jgi:multiple sugar transport system substrate-binding protein
LREYAKKCTLDSDGDGKVDVYGFGMDLGLKEFPAQALFCASSGSTLKVGEDGSITPNVNTMEFKNYLQLLADMKSCYEPDFATLDHHKVGTLFAQQKVAMAIAGTWIWDMNKNMATDTFYGQALVPKMDENSPDGSYSGGFAICVNKNTKNPAEAVKFAQLLCAPENNARLMSDIPASNGGLAASSIAKDAKYATFMKQIAYGRQAQPKTLFYAQIDTATYDEIVKVIYGKDTVDQAIKNLEESINTIVKK